MCTFSSARWSRDRAINFLSGYSDFPLSQIAAEVDRYITAPGQACSYKVGEIKIKKIRAKAEKALGMFLSSACMVLKEEGGRLEVGG